ncbi:MAG: Gfo/Idh/MocA family oxidoreductase [Planctomycetes bacterium]|nr:Gfo/Idh/MocA family oxidoreductase [Planctomycetota bacterium]
MPAPRSPEAPRAGPGEARRIGIVGAGRTRQGLGPYLADWFERHGCRVTAISGRDPGRTAAAGVAIAERLRHPVEVCADAQELATRVDALVVACPVPGHLDGLDAALAAGVPCLCEKPLVGPAALDAGLARVAAFRSRGLLLAENCQWPFALAAWDELFGARPSPPREVAMGLSPSGTGPGMVEDSLSHVLSLVQALAPLPPEARVEQVRHSDRGAHAERNDVRFRIVGGAEPIDVVLHLARCPSPPRPAWFALDGRRLDREIGPAYAIAFRAADGRAAKVRDPLDLLVYRFAADLAAEADPSRAQDLDATRAQADAIALRLRLFAAVLDAR